MFCSAILIFSRVYLFKALHVWLTMRSVLHFLGNVSSLECKKPVIYDTNLEGVKVENLQAKFLEYASETNGCIEVLTSGLIEATAFPLPL